MLKKAFTLGVVMATIVWTMGVAAFVPVASAATLTAGDLIKASGPAVYYYAADGKRYTFPTESTYYTWYSDFSGVKTISDDELAAISLAGNIVVRPGTKLVKITSVPKVFAVEPQGKLKHIDSEASAIALYGAGWATRVIDIPDGFWVNYTDSGEALDGTEYPAGQLVKMSTGSDVYYMGTDGKARKIATEAAFTANRWKWTDVMSAPASMTFAMGAEISGYLAEMADTSQGGGAPSQQLTGGALSVALASGTPSSRVVPKNTPVEMTRLNLCAGSKDVSINSLTFTLSGLGGYVDATDTTLYVAGEKTGNSKNFNSDRKAVFNFSDPIVVSSGACKEVSVKNTLTDVGYYAVGINAAADISSNASSVSGSFALVGNTMNAVDTGSADIGTLTFDADDNDGEAQVGEDDVTAVEFTVEADNKEDIHLQGLTLKNNGNMKGADVGTFTLYHDGEEVDSATMSDDKYVTFSFDAVKIAKGDVEDFKVTVDFESGEAGDTVELYVKDSVDVDAYGGSYGYQVAIDKDAFDNDDADSTEIELTAGQLTMNFDKSAVPAANVLPDTDNLVVANLELTANAEAVTINELKLDVIMTNFTDADIENIELVDLSTNGVYDLTLSGGKYVSNDEIYLSKGVKKEFNVRLDLLDDADLTDDGDEAFYVTLAAADIDAEGEASDSTLQATDISPNSVSSRTMTLVESGLTITTKALNAVDTVIGAEDVSVYKGELKAASATDVKVTKVVVDATDSSSFNSDDVTEAKLVINGNVVKTVSGSKITANGGLTFDNFSLTVPKSTTYTMYVKASFDDNQDDDTAFTMTVTAVTAKDANSNTIDMSAQLPTSAGPTVTVADGGDLTVTLSTSETGANHDIYTTAGTTSGFVGALKLDATEEDAKVKDLTLIVEDPADAEDVVASLQKVEIVDSNKSTVIGSTTDFTVGDIDGDGDADDVSVLFEDWDYVVPESGVKTVYVRVVTNEIGTDADQTSVSGAEIVFGVSAVEAEGNDSGSDYAVAAVVGAMNTATVVAARPTAIVNDMSNGTLVNGSGVIAKFKFTVENNGNTDSDGEAAQLDLGDVTFTFNYSGIVLDAGVGDDIRIYWSSNTSNKISYDLDGGDTIDLSSLGEISGTDTLVIEAINITGAGADGDYIQVKLDDLDSGNLNWDDQVGASNASILLDYDYVTGGTLSN